MRTVKAIIDEQGKVELLEPVTLGDKRQALVTILEPSHAQANQPETSLLTFLDRLASLPASSRTPETIEADIQAERNAWET